MSKRGREAFVDADGHLAMHIPEYMHRPILDYINRGLEPGGFLSAVISNDLRGAFAYADHNNMPVIQEYVRYFYNFAPSQCWGSPERLSAWVESGGLEGKS